MRGATCGRRWPSDAAQFDGRLDGHLVGRVDLCEEVELDVGYDHGVVAVKNVSPDGLEIVYLRRVVVLEIHTVIDVSKAIRVRETKLDGHRMVVDGALGTLGFVLFLLVLFRHFQSISLSLFCGHKGTKFLRPAVGIALPISLRTSCVVKP